MTEEEFLIAFAALSQKLTDLPEIEAQAFHGEWHALIRKARTAGFALPDGAQELDEKLTEAAIEAQFDNLPV